MSSHLSIGAVFTQAWRLFRYRFALLFLLGLLQGASMILALFWRDLYFYFSLYKISYVLPYMVSQPGVDEIVLSAGLVLFLFASTAMVLLTRQQPSASRFWSSMLRRFLPVLVASALCLGAISLVLYGWFLLASAITRNLLSQMVLVGLTVAAAVLVTGFASLMFVTLPAAALETGGPLRAMRRSLALTSGQRWRLCAIILILLAGLALAAMLGSWGVAWHIADTADADPLLYAIIAIGLTFTAFLLILTLVIASAYHQMVLLKDGVSAEIVGVVFE